MHSIEIKEKIENALQNLAMSDEVRKLLIELKDELKDGLPLDERMAIYAKWVEIILTTIYVTYEIIKQP